MQLPFQQQQQNPGGMKMVILESIKFERRNVVHPFLSGV
jgi:hypothetical protein